MKARDQTAPPRPRLHRVPVRDVWPLRSGTIAATMRDDGQWDEFLHCVYDGGGVLLELNAREEIVAAYKFDPQRN